MAVMDTLGSSPSSNHNGGRREAGGVSGANSSATHPHSTSISSVGAVLPPPPALPSTPTFTSNFSAAKKHCLDNGPSPEKGSGQDRFRQLILSASNNNRRNTLKNAAPVPASPATATSTTLPRPCPPGLSHYSPDLPAVNQPPFTLRTNGATQPGNMDYRSVTVPPHDTMASSSNMASTVKAESPKAQDKAGVSQGSTLRSKGSQGVNTQGTAPPGTKPGPNYQTPPYTTQLSLECQKRRFNPHFSEWIDDGAYKCSVDLDGRTLHDSHGFRSALEAKQSIAKKALVEVRKMKIPPPKVAHDAKFDDRQTWGANRSLDSFANSAPIKTENGQAPYTSRAMASRENAYPYAAPVPSAVANNDYGYGYGGHYNQDQERRRLVERIHRLYGQVEGPPPQYILGNPMASQAYLQGFALGQRAPQPSTPAAPIAPAQHVLGSFGNAAILTSASGPYEQWDRQRQRERERSPMRHQQPRPYRVRSPGPGFSRQAW
ncbi:hypothetical protein F4780DRAFT_153273 [Xylariomycetidae sp. FL0641]|nr:hypothetical protein F4780DRAFT_153273 [Xylariomycetidae sp. FL0641]